MPNFTKKLEDMRTDALDYITSILKERGTDYQLIDPACYDESIDDKIYQLPRAFTVGKYSLYSEFPIVSIDIKDNVLTFKGIGTGLNENDEDHDFPESEVGSDCLMAIATLVTKLENGHL